MSRKIYINESSINKLISEDNFNFHYSSGGGEDSKPHYSENKFQINGGRGTGHFGSGTYFSTYSYNDYPSKYGNQVSNDKRYIKIDDNLYRVDFDLYKNLFRVHSKTEGDVLFTLMKNLNFMYSKINSNFGKFDKNSATYDNSIQYQIIKKNSKALGLKCPSYMELTRMAQELGKDDDRIESFSTYFMEWNGYNGVNVSGIPFYDNTTHGSVIYDLSKVSGDIEKVDDGEKFISARGNSFANTIVRDGWEDSDAESLNGDTPQYGSYLSDKLNEMDNKHAIRILKNYTLRGIVPPMSCLSNLRDSIAKRYLEYLFVKNPTYDNYKLCDEFIDEYSFAKLVKRIGAWYWLKYKHSDNSDTKLLVNLAKCYDFDFDNPSWDEEEDKHRKYIDFLLQHVDRNLTEMEKFELGLDDDE
mgnify:FL=1